GNGLEGNAEDLAEAAAAAVVVVVEVVLLDVGQDQVEPAAAAGPVGRVQAGRCVPQGVNRVVVAAAGKGLVGCVVVVGREGDLLEVVAALHAVGGLAHLLDRRQQQADEHRDDGNDDQQLDEREGTSSQRPRTELRHGAYPPSWSGASQRRIEKKPS